MRSHIGWLSFIHHGCLLLCKIPYAIDLRKALIHNPARQPKCHHRALHAEHCGQTPVPHGTDDFLVRQAVAVEGGDGTRPRAVWRDRF